MSAGSPGPSIVLALDTSGPTGSVAIGGAGEILAEVTLERRAEHAARLVPAISEALADAGLEVAALRGLLVGAGPGSFTGVRVAAATAKGLARALAIPLRAVSSLAAAALTADGAGQVRYALFDARSDRVYGACYAVAPGRVEALVEPHAGTLPEVLDGEVPVGAVFLGDGAERHRAALEASGHRVDGGGAHGWAVGLLRYLEARPETPSLSDPSVWEPTYLRASRAVPS